MSQTDFAASFDAINASALAPCRDAIEHALAACAKPAEPGFYLLDDADGRFAVDRATGVITLAAAETLEREQGTVRTARLLVIEPSGARYELCLRLKLTGMVPHMAGEEDLLAPPRRPLDWTRFAAAEIACAQLLSPTLPAELCFADAPPPFSSTAQWPLWRD